MSTTSQEVRPQAGPLPSKRGEIGFQEGVHEQIQPADGPSSSDSVPVPVPERHPADTPPPAATTPSRPSTTADVPSSTTVDVSRAASPTTSSVDTTGKSLISFLKPKRIPLVYGLRITTLAVFILQASAVCGTIVGWVLAIRHIATDSGATSGMSMDSGSTEIFVFVVFAVLTIAQLIFLERTLFRLRAERYGFIHPGEVLPRHHSPHAGQPAPGIGIVPWHRPSLPTYAAALAQSGVGTGDVEDNIIAVPPPPAYGNTRGSTLLLAGFLGTRRQSTRSSVVSQRSEAPAPAPEAARPERPKSYLSYDEEWEERLDITAAAVLEENLARLEEGDVTDARSLHTERS